MKDKTHRSIPMHRYGSMRAAAAVIDAIWIDADKTHRSCTGYNRRSDSVASASKVHIASELHFHTSQHTPPSCPGSAPRSEGALKARLQQAATDQAPDDEIYQQAFNVSDLDDLLQLFR
jgi:hypothetical protein